MNTRAKPLEVVRKLARCAGERNGDSWKGLVSGTRGERIVTLCPAGDLTRGKRETTASSGKTQKNLARHTKATNTTRRRGSTKVEVTRETVGSDKWPSLWGAIIRARDTKNSKPRVKAGRHHARGPKGGVSGRATGNQSLVTMVSRRGHPG